ncbi:MAG: hypothetical protein AAF607_16600 [Pseudomonadota bacterium]
MSFFLYKPHVHGPEGITTPDILIDHVFVSAEEGDEYISAHTLTSESYLTLPHSTFVFPAYATIAAGAGAIIAPMLCIENGRYVLSRQAHRVAHLPDEEIYLGFENEAWPLPEVQSPLDHRGHCRICMYPQASTELLVPDRVDVTLLARTSVLSELNVHAEPAAMAPSKATPRYSVGPQSGDVKHYI